MTKANIGNDINAAMLGGDVAGTTGTSTAVGATSLTDSGASWVANAYAGHFVVTGAVMGVVLSNTSTVLTIDQWSTPGSSDVAASTPATGTYNILPGNAPARHVALSTDSGSVGTGATTLPSEITTASGGLVAKRGVYSHTTGAGSYAITTVFTANGSDSLPVTIAKMGVRQSIKAACNCLFQTLFGTPATLSASGDQVTVTDTVATV